MKRKPFERQVVNVSAPYMAINLGIYSSVYVETFLVLSQFKIHILICTLNVLLAAAALIILPAQVMKCSLWSTRDENCLKCNFNKKNFI